MIKYTLILVFGLLLNFHLRADSPITSIFPASAYTDILIINSEIQDNKNELSLEECEFLFATTNPLDQKFALINALGWGDSTKVETYVKFLMVKYQLSHWVFDSILTWRGNQPVQFEPAKQLNADDYSCLAYLLVNGNYFAPLKGYYCAYHAADLKPGSEAAAYVYGLIMAQFFLDNEPCKVFEVMESIRIFDGYNEDRIRAEALTNIFTYINLYESACGRTPETNIANYYNKPDQPQKIIDKKNYVDLVITEIKAPEFEETIHGTRFVVRIKNNGTISSIETNAKLMDLDITASDAKKRKFEKSWIQAIKENNENAVDSTHKGYKVDMDYDWEKFVKIPILQPGEEIELIFLIENHWVYDPNCEIELFLDFDQNIEEKNEMNNSKAFVAWG
jgi:hypothetical protein